MAGERYIYGSAAPKRDRYSHESPRRSERSGPRIGVVPGGSAQADRSSAYETALLAAKATLVLIVVFAIISFCRITLASATVAEAVQAGSIESEITEMKSGINDMQAEQSSLSNPVRIKNEARTLGMVSPEETVVIELESDVVMMEEDGSLSLTKSLSSIM